MALYEKLLKEGRLFKAIPRSLGDKEFLTVMALDPKYGDEWSEFGIGCFTYIEGSRVKNLWHHYHPALAYPQVIPEGGLVKIAEREDVKNLSGLPRMEVVGVLDEVSIMNYHVTRIIPEAPEATPAKKK